MPFNITPNVQVERDRDGVVRHLSHLQEPYVPAPGLISLRPSSLAAEYIRDVAAIYGVDQKLLSGINNPVGKALTDEGTLLQYAGEKSIMETTTLSYVQTYFGLPIWEAGLSVTLHNNPLRITSSHSTVHLDVKVQKPDPRAKFAPDRISQSVLAALLRLKEKMPRPKVNRMRLLIYRYDPTLRFDPESQHKEEKGALQEGPPVLPLPAVPKTIKSGVHYVVTEVLFTLAVAALGEVHWRTFIELQTGGVLYLRAFIASATGYVFAIDPATASGDTPPNSPTPNLNALRTLVTLPDVTPPAPGNPQALTGSFVRLSEISAPATAPPTEISGNFLYDVPTDNFSAVNAYYNVDVLFDMMQGMGFNISTYFDGTTANPGFPIPVDHRGLGSVVNAQGPGNSTGDGSGGFQFALAQAGTTVGIADDARVVAHEFCHALLWDSVNSPNFGFAHSAGDSLGAIINDPGSQAPDRFLTFPWISAVPRRHDRPVAGGWAWGGVNDVGGYSSEQILSTTLFRIYRMTGGDSAHPDPAFRLATQRLAARWMAYLIIRGIGSLATSPITPTPTPDVFATALMNADGGTTLFDGIPGGTVQKVIRWGFEKQGLFQPAGAPTPVTTEGAAPPVDVYIDDGRNGEYAPYLDGFWNTTDIWNRLTATPGAGPGDHETPVTTVPNYVYVNVKNRGSQSANNVVVRGFHCRPSTGLVWPDDWEPMTTAEITVAGGIAPGTTVTVGPFEWTPIEVGHECLLMYVSASGDLSNADPASMLPSATGPTPHWRLVPFDNNIAQRNVAPVAGGGGGLNLAKSFERRRFWANNPYQRPARIVIESLIPDFLRERGWDIQFLSPGGPSFTLGPRGNREVVISLKQGKEFSPSDIKNAADGSSITIRTLIDGAVVGGMTYAIDPKLKAPPAERPRGAGKPDCTEAARDLLECLRLPAEKVKCVRVKRIVVEIDLNEDC